MQSTSEIQVWTKCQNLLEANLNRQSFETWFKRLRFVGYDYNSEVVQLQAPNQTVKDWVSTNYSELIRHCFDELDMNVRRFEWIIEDESKTAADDSRLDELYSQSEVSVSGSNSQTANLLSMMNSNEVTGLKTGATNFVDIEPLENPLNPKCKFGTFVVGSCNQFAHAAALAVAESPGKTYNPLYIYGGVGLGKTHLMHAIGHAVKERNRYLRLLYISAEKFMNELINAIRYDKTQNFREKYRSIDVLLMDDIQFMAGKERTQEEFFHTFNALYDGQKQIVITSDCPPREIPTLEERLHSRFEWGLIADMEPPDLETKVAILKRKADLDGVVLPDDVALFIAGKVKSNIRELEGSLVRLVAISSLRGLSITKLLAQDAIRNITEETKPEGITVERIQRAVASHYRLKLDDLLSKNNSRHIAVPRQVAMYLCKKLTKYSFPEIGRQFSGKHHTTVIHSVEKIEALINKDTNFHRVVSDISDSL
ncbi:MAG: chromosomal replication initiator protein DnaA [Pyrinomonadaceae bacterium MAG19_C2-C3]|nr:chromosomal replication initiator protein DnaA [Pyrinomonadaceae bacterium MAG19_C2-C3]